MAVIQISKIQLRRGTEGELLEDSLDPGEMALTIDSGRLFIGADPDHTGPWTGRATMPYNNIEVLTEAGLETFARLFDRLHRTLGPIGLVEGADTFQRRPYLEATLEINSEWSSVMINRLDPATGSFLGDTEELTLVDANSLGGVIQYFLLDDTSVVRTGTLSVIHDGNPSIDAARVVDENVAVPSIVGNGTPILVDDLFVTGVEFRVMRVSSGPSEYRMRLEYKNSTATEYTVQVRAMVTARINP